MLHKAKKIILIIVLLLGIGLSFFSSYLIVYYHSHTFPQTYIGTIDVSNKTRSEINSIISTLSGTTIQLSMKDRTYEYTLPLIGISLDNEKILESAFKKNNESFIPFIQSLIASITQKTTLQPELLLSESYKEFTSTIHALSNESDGLALDPTGQQFIIVRNEERYTIDPISLKQELTAFLTDPSHIYRPKLVSAPSTKAGDAKQYNTLLDSMYAQPMNVIITDGLVNQSIVLLPDQLKTLFTTHFDAGRGMIGFSIKDNIFLSSIKPLYSHIKLSPDVSVLDTDAKRLLTDAMTKRAEGNISQGAILGATIGPNSDGTKAYKYIEVDISQQRMYLFQNGSMIASFRVSTGKYLPTPTGEFSIMNKAKSGAYSSIYHVYMPFWMAFYFKDAYYGIHELPYYFSGDGKKIQRPREFIGSPNTGGCIALDIGDAEYVFNFGEVGMKVVIFN